MNYTVDGITDELHRLVSKLEKHESNLDALIDSVIEIPAPFKVQYQSLEDVLTFEELSKRVENHPRGWLILCLAAENKELEQLQDENNTLVESLDKYQSALDLIMKKYRLQVSQLMQTNRMECLLRNNEPRLGKRAWRSAGSSCLKSDDISPDEGLVRAELINNKYFHDNNGSTTSEPTTTMLSTRLATLASMTQDVCNRGDAYTTQLEAELHRLRAENAGLRELLTISSDFAANPPDVSEVALSTDRTVPVSSSTQLAPRVNLPTLTTDHNSSNTRFTPLFNPKEFCRTLDDLLPVQSNNSPSNCSAEDCVDYDGDDDVTVADGSESSD